MLIRFFLKNTARYPLGTTIFGLLLSLLACVIIVASIMLSLTHTSDRGNIGYGMGSALVGLIMGIVLTIRGLRAMADRKALRLQEMARAQRKIRKAERKRQQSKSKA